MAAFHSGMLVCIATTTTVAPSLLSLCHHIQWIITIRHLYCVDISAMHTWQRYPCGLLQLHSNFGAVYLEASAYFVLFGSSAVPGSNSHHASKTSNKSMTQSNDAWDGIKCRLAINPLSTDARNVKDWQSQWRDSNGNETHNLRIDIIQNNEITFRLGCEISAKQWFSSNFPLCWKVCTCSCIKKGLNDRLMIVCSS